MRLPRLIKRHEFWPAYALAWAPYIALYQIVGRFPLRTPVQLRLSAIDRAIPFWPEFLPVYVGYLVYYWWTVARSEDDVQANRIWYATHFELLISLPFFLLYPVYMPRELFYSPEAYSWADGFWRWFDAPYNCFPSLHVSNVLMLMQFNHHRDYRGLSHAFGLLIIASTMLVKQHYVVDVAAGLLVYAAAAWIMRRVIIED